MRSYSGEARTERALEKSSSVDAVRSASVAGKSIADMFMYRSRPGSSAVLTRVGTVNAQIGDRAELGELGCSVDGLGVVTAVCETKRRKSVNPF